MKLRVFVKLVQKSVKNLAQIKDLKNRPQSRREERTRSRFFHGRGSKTGRYVPRRYKASNTFIF